MLKQRLLTAAFLIPLVLLALFYLPLLFYFILTAVVLLGAWEWSALAGWHTPLRRSIYVSVVALTLGLLYVVSALFKLPEILSITLSTALFWWLYAAYIVVRYQYGHNLLPKNRLSKSLIGLIVLLPPWLAILLVLQVHAHYVLLLFLLIWGADSGAYFAGRQWGKRKLATKVSPKKTWEGVFGALATAVVIIGIYALALSWSNNQILWFALLGIVIVFVSVLGDLLESLFKREANIKDSGNILPGHGGILDRIDSLTAAAPIFALSLWLMLEKGLIHA